MPNLRAIVTLGRIAHDSTVAALATAAGSAVRPRRGTTSVLRALRSYHCSRYNTNTGVLTPKMFPRACALFWTAARANASARHAGDASRSQAITSSAFLSGGKHRIEHLGDHAIVDHPAPCA